MTKISDTYATPWPVFNRLDSEFNFSHDVCAALETAKCPTYWTAEDDALSKDWHLESNKTFSNWLWCNPPYSNIMPWVEKAAQAQRDGTGVVMLVMADPSVKWFTKALESASEVRFMTEGRLSFLMDGKPVNGNNRGSVIFVFDPWRIGACHVSFVPRSEFFRESVQG